VTKGRNAAVGSRDAAFGLTPPIDERRALFATTADDTGIPQSNIVLNWMAEAKK
jgi:hypothetical protein